MIEKVNPSHPDKVADRIAGAIVDLAYTAEENPKIAVDVLLGRGVRHIIAERPVHIPQEEAAAPSAARREFTHLFLTCSTFWGNIYQELERLSLFHNSLK